MAWKSHSWAEPSRSFHPPTCIWTCCPWNQTLSKYLAIAQCLQTGAKYGASFPASVSRLLFHGMKLHKMLICYSDPWQIIPCCHLVLTTLHAFVYHKVLLSEDDCWVNNSPSSRNYCFKYHDFAALQVQIWIWIWHYQCMGRWQWIFQVQRDLQLFPFEGINICGCFPLRHKRIHGNRDIFRERWAFEYRAHSQTIKCLWTLCHKII